MGIFDKITKLAEKAAEAVVKTSDKINKTYQEDGFDGLVNKTANTFTKAGQKTQDYLNNLGEKNKQILDSIPDKDLEGTLAKATAVVINTTQTIVKDAATLTKNTVESVSKNIDQTLNETSQKNVTEKSESPVESTKKTTSTKKQLFLNEGEIAELDCMPIILLVKELGAKTNIDGEKNKFSIDGANFVTNDQKWYDFNNNKGGSGAISFMNHYIRCQNDLVDNTSVEVNKEILHSSLDILSNIHKMKEYNETLSVWIKEENAKNKNVQSVKSDDNVEPVKTKRIRKPSVKATETNSVTEEIVKTPKKVVKKTVKEPLVVATKEQVLPKATKKVVKKAVEETFATPVKSRKPKV